MTHNNAVVLDKDSVRDIVTRIANREPSFSPGSVGIEQATNAIMRLQRPAQNAKELALTVHCEYCGRTAGNACRNASGFHPSRLIRSLPSAPHDPEPTPGDGPDYHADHAAWVRRNPAHSTTGEDQ